MAETDIADVMRITGTVILTLAGPLLGVALVVGLIVAIIQAVTQINEATLAFLPKLVLVAGVLAMLGPFMVASLSDYSRSLMDQVVAVGGR